MVDAQLAGMGDKLTKEDRVSIIENAIRDAVFKGPSEVLSIDHHENSLQTVARIFRNLPPGTAFALGSFCTSAFLIFMSRR